jgi:hypothetical protein
LLLKERTYLAKNAGWERTYSCCAARLRSRAPSQLGLGQPASSIRKSLEAFRMWTERPSITNAVFEAGGAVLLIVSPVHSCLHLARASCWHLSST